MARQSNTSFFLILFCAVAILLVVIAVGRIVEKKNISEQKEQLFVQVLTEHEQKIVEQEQVLVQQYVVTEHLGNRITALENKPMPKPEYFAGNAYCISAEQPDGQILFQCKRW